MVMARATLHLALAYVLRDGMAWHVMSVLKTTIAKLAISVRFFFFFSFYFC